jgi:hypothetical protein
VSSSYGAARGDLLRRQSRNEEMIFWRNLPRGVLLRSLPAHVAVVIAKAFRRWREGQLLPFLRGRASLLAEFRELLHSRRGLGRISRPRQAESWDIERAFRPRPE